ncbi:MAG: YegS/Rv2252/BmrU family lipid kinase [Eubacteriales bacterium]|nr:YegS/Rv2252/BmrU family lipid kinase [Eubacteriales bacterium]
MKRILMIMNPFAGTMQANKVLDQIIQIFCKAGYETVVAMTQKRGDGTVIARQRGGEADIVVAVGGDGTFNEVISGVIESGIDVPIGYIPAGTTNDFANSLKLPTDLLKAAKCVVKGSPRRLDVGCFNGRYFSYVASFGAFTKTSYGVPQSLKNMIGHMAYIIQGIKEVTSIKRIPMTLVDDQGKVHKGPYFFGAISNSTSMGGVLTLDKEDVDMSDGEFEVLLVKAADNVFELNREVMALTRNNYKESDMIDFFSTSSITIKAQKETDWTLDGEYQEGCQEIQIDNIHDGIQIIIPTEELRKKEERVININDLGRTGFDM